MFAGKNLTVFQHEIDTNWIQGIKENKINWTKQREGKTTRPKRTINDVLRKMKEISLENENNDDDQEDDENKKCDKANCKIDKAIGDDILLVQCGKRY